MKMTGFARRAEPRIIKESPPQTENINVSHVVGGGDGWQREKNDRDVEVLCRGREGGRERNREMTKRSNLYASE